MRPKLIFSNYKFRCPAKRAGPPLESKWKCEKIAPIRAFARTKREKEGYDISERADNYLNNPETRASRLRFASGSRSSTASTFLPCGSCTSRGLSCFPQLLVAVGFFAFLLRETVL